MYTGNNQKGFTLIEMMATMAIITILAMGIIPMSQVAHKRSKEMELRNHLRIIRTALDEYKQMVDDEVIPKSAADSGYPKDLEVLVQGVRLNDQVGTIKKFLRRIPKDPMTEDGQWGLRSYTDRPESTIWGGQDVYDIYSLSEKQAIDGSYYAEW